MRSTVVIDELRLECDHRWPPSGDWDAKTFLSIPCEDCGAVRIETIGYELPEWLAMMNVVAAP